MSEKNLLKLMVELSQQDFIGSAQNVASSAPQPSLPH